MKHVIIWGPPGCGKTRNKAKLAKAFGCRNIMDGVDVPEIKERATRAAVKTLYLTNQRPPDIDTPAMARRADVLDFFEAMRRAGISP